MLHEISPIPHGNHGFLPWIPWIPRLKPSKTHHLCDVSGPRAAEHGLRHLRRKAQGAQAQAAVRGEAAGQTDADRNASRPSGDVEKIDDSIVVKW